MGQLCINCGNKYSQGSDKAAVIVQAEVDAVFGSFHLSRFFKIVSNYTVKNKAAYFDAVKKEIPDFTEEALLRKIADSVRADEEPFSALSKYVEARVIFVNYLKDFAVGVKSHLIIIS